MGPYPTSAVGVLLALAAAGCSDNNPPTGAELAHEIKGTKLPAGIGVVTTGYCRHDASGKTYTCVLRTARGRVTCTVSLDKENQPGDKICVGPAG